MGFARAGSNPAAVAFYKLIKINISIILILMGIWDSTKPHYAHEAKNLWQSLMDYIAKWSSFEE